MKILVVKPLNSSLGSIRILICDCSIALWLICCFVSVYPYFGATCSLVFL
uniref:Uncharacterized protein n=1 Tax=Rhizophora mucronata TaxID=61149 RepID=A0A2P2J4T0_RHIMU